MTKTAIEEIDGEGSKFILRVNMLPQEAHENLEESEVE